MPSEERSPKSLAQDILADAGYAATLFDAEPEDRSVAEAATEGGRRAERATRESASACDDGQAMQAAAQEPECQASVATVENVEPPSGSEGVAQSGVAEDGTWTADAVADMAAAAGRPRHRSVVGWSWRPARRPRSRRRSSDGASASRRVMVVPGLLAAVAVVASAMVVAALARGTDSASTGSPTPPAEQAPAPLAPGGAFSPKLMKPGKHARPARKRRAATAAR